MRAAAEQWLLYRPMSHEAGVGQKKLRIELFQSADLPTLRQNVAEIDRVLLHATNAVGDQLRDDFIWLHWQTDGEAEKRAVVYSGRVTIPGEQASSPHLLACTLHIIIELDVGVWEDLCNDPPINITAIDRIGGHIHLPPGGTANGRISQLIVYDPASDGFNHCVVGIKPPRRYGSADFVAWWPAQVGTTLSVPPTMPGVFIGYGGNAMAKGTFVIGWNHQLGAELGVFTLALANVAPTANYLHFIGRYRVLMRYRVNGATGATPHTLRFRLQAGYTNGEMIDVGEPVLVTVADSVYHIVDLGYMEIPTTAHVQHGPMIAQFQIMLFSTLLGGNTLSFADVDGFVMMPADHIVMDDGTFVNDDGGLYIQTTPNNTIIGYAENVTISSVSWFRTARPVASAWGAPYDGGVMVVCAGIDTSLSFSATKGDIGVALSIVRRWQSYSTTTPC